MTNITVKPGRDTRYISTVKIDGSSVNANQPKTHTSSLTIPVNQSNKSQTVRPGRHQNQQSVVNHQRIESSTQTQQKDNTETEGAESKGTESKAFARTTGDKTDAKSVNNNTSPPPNRAPTESNNVATPNHNRAHSPGAGKSKNPQPQPDRSHSLDHAKQRDTREEKLKSRLGIDEIIDLTTHDQRFKTQAQLKGLNGVNPSQNPANVADASIPNGERRTNINSPVFFLSPNALGKAPSNSLNVKADHFIQGKIDENSLPDSIKNNQDQLSALKDIRSRFDPNWTLKTEFNATSKHDYVDNWNTIYKDSKNSDYNEKARLVPSSKNGERNLSQPAAGSYIHTEIKIPSNWTESGQEAHIYAYSKVTGDGQVVTNDSLPSKRVLLREQSQTIHNQTSNDATITEGTVSSASSGNSNSQFETETSETAVGFSLSGEAGGGTPVKSGGAKVGLTVNHVNTQSTGSSFDHVSSNGQQNSRNVTNTVGSQTSVEETNYFLGNLVPADIIDVSVSMPHENIFDELIDDNQDINLYIQDSFAAFKPRGDEGTWAGLDGVPRYDDVSFKVGTVGGNSYFSVQRQSGIPTEIIQTEALIN